MTAPRGLHELPAPPDELAELSQRLGERISAETDPFVWPGLTELSALRVAVGPLFPD